jgi:hypothetical protein
MTSNIPDNSHNSLKARIEQRHADRIRREADARIIARQTGTMSAVTEALHTAPKLDVKADQQIRTAHKRTTQVARAVSTRAVSTTQPIRPMKRNIVALVGAIFLLIFAGLTIMVSPSTNAASAPMSTAIPMDTATAQTALDYLRSVNQPISNIRSLEVPNTRWNARDGIEISLDSELRGRNVRILTYDSIEQANRDVFSVHVVSDHPFAEWQIVQVSNVIILAPPDTRAELVEDIASHLTTLMLRPYRDFLPTATVPGY